MSARAGVVYLVGAGPGDPGLMTSRSLELIATADVIFHDRLIPPGALAGARPDAELLYVGKQPGSASVPQDEISSRMVEAARNGRSVVRLKGGDPFVFGRGAEEAEALRAAGVEFEVVPGVTAGVAAAAYAGIPVTHRDDASAVAFVTGHEDPGKAETSLDWEALARFPGTLVFYMGVKRLAENALSLISAGRDPDEPAAAIERGTTARPANGLRHPRNDRRSGRRRADRGTGADRRRHRGGPARGARVARAPSPRRPPRRRHPGAGAGQRAGGEPWRELGAEVVEMPAIRIVPRLDSEEVRQTVDDLHAYALVCLTSPNGAHLLFEAMAAAGRDARALANATVAAIGPGTAAALAEHGIVADIVPERFVAEALVEALAPVEVSGRPALVARAAEARDVLPDALRERGAEVDVVALYETVREEPSPESVEAAQDADYLTFTSSSTVRNFAEAVGDRLPGAARVVSIGPVTSEAAREAGLDVAVEAERHDVEGLVEALVADARGLPGSGTRPRD